MKAMTAMPIIRRKLSIAAALISALLTLPLLADAQTRTVEGGVEVDGIVRFDKTIHDFGDVLLSEGPKGCSFTVTNIYSKPIAILNVVSSCGCTDVEWTREPLQPGKSGTIKATFSNDQGPHPFDKSLTVYISSVKKPVILHLRGVAHDKKLSLGELYPVRAGDLGLKETDIKLGNMEQGSQRSDAVSVANMGSSPLGVSFKDVSDGLKVSVAPNPIPAGETARLTYTITADRSHWGKNYYYATPVANGVAGPPIGIWSFTKEDFSSLTDEQMEAAGQPYFAESTYNFGVVKAGAKVDPVFTFKNEGKGELVIYKVDSDSPSLRGETPPIVYPGKKGSVKMHLDTASLPKGEVLIIVTLTTNSPLRPIVNLFVAGAVE